MKSKKLQTEKSLNRMKRELLTVEKMINIYCKINHKETILCSNCSELLDYVKKKLDNCPFYEDKPVCVNCSVHCYKKQEREQIKEIMRFSGPKMIYKHPYLAIRHLIDEKLIKHGK